MVMPRALVNFSPWLRICNWLELRGKWMVRCVEGGTNGKNLPVCTYTCMCHDCRCVVNGSSAMAAS